MSIRRTFLLLVVPLFVLLAGVNGALLYAWERAEAERGLEAQAIAAAVTTAAFADASQDLATTLDDPGRAAALRSAAGRVTGLRGIFVVGADARALRIVGTAPRPGRLSPPTAPRALPIGPDAAGRQVAMALAPMSGGRFVVAQIDAEPLLAEVTELQRLILGLVVAAGLVGLVLALAIACSIVGELAANRAMIEAIRNDAPAGDAERFRIRETRDLALAVGLMRTSVLGRLARGRHELARRDRERNEATSVAAYRETAFPPLSVTATGAAIAVRTLGEAPAGSFYALAATEERAVLVLGECAGQTPSAALARALAARRFFESEAGADHVAGARAAYVIERLERFEWTTAAPLAGRALALLDGDNAARAAIYVQRAAGLTPDEIAADLATLLQARGVLAVAASAEAGER